METLKIIRRFERFMLKAKSIKRPIDNDSKIIGYFTYDFKNQTEKFTQIDCN